MNASRPNERFPREADEAINIVTDNGFGTLGQAVNAVRNKLVSCEIAEHLTLRDWIECIRAWAGTGWDGIEKSTKPWRSDVWTASFTHYVGCEQTRPWFVVFCIRGLDMSEEAQAAAVAVLKAEKRCKAKDVDRAAARLRKASGVWKGGRVLVPAAFRLCDKTSAFDWYVMLLVTLSQNMGVKVDGFEVDEELVKRRRGGLHGC